MTRSIFTLKLTFPIVDSCNRSKMSTTQFALTNWLKRLLKHLGAWKSNVFAYSTVVPRILQYGSSAIVSLGWPGWTCLLSIDIQDSNKISDEGSTIIAKSLLQLSVLYLSKPVCYLANNLLTNHGAVAVAAALSLLKKIYLCKLAQDIDQNQQITAAGKRQVRCLLNEDAMLNGVSN